MKIYVAQLSIKNYLSLPIKELELTAGFNVFSKQRAASNSSCFRARVLEKRQMDTLLNYFIVAGVINFYFIALKIPTCPTLMKGDVAEQY